MTNDRNETRRGKNMRYYAEDSESECINRWANRTSMRIQTWTTFVRLNSPKTKSQLPQFVHYNVAADMSTCAFLKHLILSVRRATDTLHCILLIPSLMACYFHLTHTPQVLCVLYASNTNIACFSSSYWNVVCNFTCHCQ